MTVRDLITRSLKSLGKLAAGEPLDNADAADALVVLSDLLDRWQTERLTIYSQTRTENALVNGQQRYTLGPSGDWNQARPLWIDTAARLTAENWESEIELLTRTKWARVPDKSLTSTLPVAMFVNPTFPLAAVDVWPVPTDSTVKIVLYTPAAALTSVSSLDTVLSLAPGWSSALRYALACALAPEYGLDPSATLVDLARTSKAAIKRTNQLADEMILDPALTRRRGAVTRAEFEGGDF